LTSQLIEITEKLKSKHYKKMHQSMTRKDSHV